MVQYKRGLQQLRSSALGDGLLERARAMSLALLGATAAVGLAIVALALNQGWPLVGGSGIPDVQPPRQGVGGATVAARSHASARSHGAGHRRARPEESNVPSWSNGKGHAYGREGRED